MGRKDIIRSIVLQCFIKKDSNSKLYQCQYCSQQYALNVTRMSNHLCKKCKHCPKKIKVDIDQKSKASTSGSSRYIDKNKGETTTSAKRVIVEKEIKLDDGDTDSDENSISMALPECALDSPEKGLSSTTLRSTGSLDLFVDKIHQSEQDKVWELLARACYASNTPLNFTENVHWQRVFKKIKPSLKLPSRYQLSNSLLEKEYDKIHEQVVYKIKSAKTIGIQIDGWSNVRNESIINVIITTPDPVLYKTIDTKTNRHDMNYLFNLLSSIIDDLGLAKVMTVTTDNATNMKATWELLNINYSSGYFSCYGCCAHILNLLINDILKLELFSSTTQICKRIVKSIKRSHILNSTFSQIQKEQYELDRDSSSRTLKLPVQTRWASVIFCLQSLRLNKQNLKRLAITEEVLDVISANLKHNILSDSFWQNVDRMYCLLQPISEYIIRIQTDKSCIAEVVEIFFNLNLIISENCPLSYLDTVKTFLQNRKEMALRPLHFAANLLDPKFMGQNLNSDEYIEALTYINKLSSHLVSGSDVGQVMMEVALYKAKEEFFAKEFLWTALSSGTLTSVIWWKSLCSTTSLSKVATEILNSPATTCATERSFSAFGNIHNKKRNKLTTDRAAKLLFVNYNLKLSETKTLLQINNNEPYSSQESNMVALETEQLMSLSEDDSECDSEYE